MVTFDIVSPTCKIVGGQDPPVPPGISAHGLVDDAPHRRLGQPPPPPPWKKKARSAPGASI